MSEPRHEEALPEPTAELVLIHVIVEAYLDGLPRKEAARFIERVNASMELRRALGAVTTIRPRVKERLLSTARLHASAWWDLAKQGYSRRVQ